MTVTPAPTEASSEAPLRDASTDLKRRQGIDAAGFAGLPAGLSDQRYPIISHRHTYPTGRLKGLTRFGASGPTGRRRPVRINTKIPWAKRIDSGIGNSIPTVQPDRFAHRDLRLSRAAALPAILRSGTCLAKPRTYARLGRYRRQITGSLAAPPWTACLA